MHNAEHRWHEEQGRAGGEEQAADHGSAERRILAGLDRHRDHADDHRERRHEHRPEAGAARLNRGRDRVSAVRQTFPREADHQDAVGGRDAHAHDRPGERGNGKGGIAREQHPDNAGQRSRQRHDDHERIEPGLEVDDDQQVDQHEGQRQTDEELLVGARHGRDLTAQGHAGAVRNLVARLLHQLSDVCGDTAEIAPLRRREDVDDGTDVVVGDNGIARRPLDRRQAAEQLRVRAAARHRDILQPVHRAERVRRRLD